MAYRSPDATQPSLDHAALPLESRPLLPPGLLAGLLVAAGAAGGMESEPSPMSLALAVLLAVGGVSLATRRSTSRPVARMAGAVAALLGAGLLSGLSIPRPTTEPLLEAADQSGEPVRFVGRLAQPVSRHLAPPRWRGVALQPRMSLIIDLTHVSGPDGWRPVQARVRLGSEETPLEGAVGDLVEGSARLVAPRAPQNPGEPDSRPALRRRGIAYVGGLQRGSLLLLEPAPSITRWSERFRARFAAYCRERLGVTADRSDAADVAALVAALAVGERGGVSPELGESFNASGLAHVLSISGLHLAVAVLALAWLLTRLLALSPWLCRRVAPARLAAMITLPVTLLYVVVTGAPAPAVRSGLGTGLLLLGRALGRDTGGINTLGWTLALMAVLDPACLFEPSAQLSFLGVLGLIAVAPVLRRWLPIAAPRDLVTESRWRRRLVNLREAVLQGALATLAATLATAPLTAWYFERASLVAAVANLVAWPASTLIVPSGALGAVLFALDRDLGGPLVSLAGLCGHALCRCARWFEQWPLASISVAPPSPLQLTGYTLLMVALCGAGRWSRRAMRRTALAGALLLLWPQVTASLRGDPAEGKLEVTFLSVGQGDATFVRFPGGSTLLVDAGGEASMRSDPGARVVTPFLRWRGVHRLDRVVASHPHPDHIGGLPSVLRRLDVGELWHDGEHADEGPAGELYTLARTLGIEVRTFVQGLPASCPGLVPLAQELPQVAALAIGDPRCRPPAPEWRIDGVRVELLHPRGGPDHSHYAELGENDNSLVLRLTHGNVRVLLPGDLEHEGESLLLASGHDLSADLLKAPHHGSRTSSTPGFVEAVRPRHVVFCVGRHNMFGFPRQEVVDRYAAAGCQRHRTDEGAVRFVSDGISISADRYVDDMF